MKDKVKNDSASQMGSAMIMDGDTSVTEFRSKVCAKWAPKEWSEAEEKRKQLLSLGLAPEMVEAMLRAAGKVSGEDLSTPTPTLLEVYEHITEYSKEFKNVCGCELPAFEDVRAYTPTLLSVSTITATSNISDYVTSAAIDSNASASAKVAAIMSYRLLIDVTRRIKVARTLAKKGIIEHVEAACRSALALGIPVSTLHRYMGMKMVIIPAHDNKERERLSKNLTATWAKVREVENSIILAAPARLVSCSIEDGCGGWVFPSVLPSSLPAKVRKLMSKRERYISVINTLNGLLEP